MFFFRRITRIFLILSLQVRCAYSKLLQTILPNPRYA